MIAFFHDTDEQNDSDEPTNEKSMRQMRSADNAPTPALGRVEKIVIG